MHDALRYPIGVFERRKSIQPSELDGWISEISTHPSKLRHAVEGLSKEQLDTPYRPGGWTVRQVVHHLADSHMNAYSRMKLALTEDRPVIKPYEEALWAELPDSLQLDT